MKTKPTPNRLCDQDCNNCSAIDNPQVAVLLNALALKFGEGVWHIANKVCPNMTVCPDCRIDDFCHDDLTGDRICAIDELPPDHESCAIAKTARAVLVALDPDFDPTSIKSVHNTQPLTPNTPNSDPADTAEKPDSAGSPTH